MSKQSDIKEQYHMAVYLLKTRFHTPHELLQYWAFSGPCQESHPIVEDLD